MYVYVLQSVANSEKHYTGFTTNVEERIKKHNNGEVSHTKKFRPWALKNYFWFQDKLKAAKFERYLKSGSGRAFCKRHF